MPAGDPYISVDELKDRVSYDGEALFEEHNEEKRFEELLSTLESEARGEINTLTGDQTFHKQTDRTDTFRATDDAAVPLVYPIIDVSKVEVKSSLASDWRELDTDRYDFTDHRLILARPTRGGSTSTLAYQRENPLIREAGRMTWRDIATKMRVTYDRGFDPIPADVKSIMVDIVNRMLRKLRNEQNISASSPEQMEAITQGETIMTDDIRRRVGDITGLGGKTQSV